MRMLLVIVLALVCTSAHPASAACTAEGPPPEGGNGRVKVFILAGQSNMEGYGHARTLPHLADAPGGNELLARLKGSDGSWKVHDNVVVYFHGGKTVGKLTVGFGAGPEYIGPELAFGSLIGETYSDPVLLIKTAWGGKDLHFDFRPPSAGKLPYPITAEALERRGGEGAVGEAYRSMVTDVKDCLGKMGEYFPTLRGRDYEIVGLVWLQGWNEMFPAEGCDFDKVVADYPSLYATMIRDLEHDLGVSRLPSVVGEMGVNGEKATGRIVQLRKRQAEIAGLQELAGKVRFVRTADLWDPALDEMQTQERDIRRAAREKIRANIESGLAAKLAGLNEKERREALNRALDEAIEKTDEFRAWNTKWETISGHWECHYWGSASTYCRIGAALATAMKDLVNQLAGDAR